MSTETVDYQSAYDRGISYISEGKMKDAVEVFESLLKSGVTSHDLELSLGRALIESGSVHDGLIHLHTALRLGRLDWSTRKDIEVAQSRVAEKQGTPMSHPVEWGYQISSAIRPNEILSLSLFLSLYLASAIYTKKIQKSGKIVGSLLIALSFGVFLLASSAKNIAIAHRDTEVRSTPLESSQVLMKIPDGARLKIVRISGAFTEIERSGSFRGWVKSEQLTPLSF
jgi:hypothetical protein